MNSVEPPRTKEEWRAWARKARRAIPAREEKARTICTQLLALAPLQTSTAVMLYAAIGEEIDLRPVAEALLARGVTVAYPVVLARGKELEARAVNEFSELVPGAFGILEPAAGCPPVPAHTLDAVIVPGLAFDREGYRVGYGGGYYDRFLPRLGPGACAIGAVYSALLCQRLPREPHDVPVDWIVTEAEAFACRPAAQRNLQRRQRARPN